MDKCWVAQWLGVDVKHILYCWNISEVNGSKEHLVMDEVHINLRLLTIVVVKVLFVKSIGCLRESMSESLWRSHSHVNSHVVCDWWFMLLHLCWGTRDGVLLLCFPTNHVMTYKPRYIHNYRWWRGEWLEKLSNRNMTTWYGLKPC